MKVRLKTRPDSVVALLFVTRFYNSFKSFGLANANSRRKKEPMLQVTQDALEICSATVRQLSTQANTKCLRIIECQDGVSISFELPRSDDELVHDLGFAVLAVPRRSVEGLSEMTLDVRDDGRFILS